MKKLLLIIVLLLIPSICLANFEITKWEFYKNITTEGEGLKKISIDDQMFSGTERDLRDLRVLDKEGYEVPYKLLKSQTTANIKTYYPKIINNSYEEGKDSSVVLDFGENNQGINSLDIKTNTENFQANVKVLGSDSLDNWRTLKERVYIYDYTDKRGNFKTQKTELNFPESVFRYLKLEIVNNQTAQVKINSVSAQKRTLEKSKELERLPEFKIEQKDSNTEIIIDLESSGIPTSKLILETKDKNFNRGVLIYSSYNKDKWRRIGGGNIFRYDTDKYRGENLQLNFSETNDQYIKLVISNMDNEPVAINEVKSYSVYREAIFQAEAGKEYRVYYGNSSARFPRYDLDSYFEYLDLNRAEAVELSTQKKNPAFKALEKLETTPKSEEIPWLMPFALIVSCLLLLFLVFRFFKEQK